LAGDTKDLLGLAPYGEALNTLTKGLVDGAGAFLGRICLPAAGEFGLLLQDKVSVWRATNAARVAAIAEAKLNSTGSIDGLHAHPRLVGAIIANGSWVDSPELQEMWGGLLASSCSEDGSDDENLLFVNFLGQMSGAQARILNLACSRANKVATSAGLFFCPKLMVSSADLTEVTGISDLHRLDRELDYLHALGLTQGGFTPDSTVQANVTPTALALNMFVRCQGSRQSVVQFFKLTATSDEDVRRIQLLG
jgi:hypothetical protein